MVADEEKKTVIQKKKATSKHSIKHEEDQQQRNLAKDASEYLSLWKHNKDTQWKFKKNIQSWLLRQTYDCDQIPKQTFVILLEYLNSVQGDTTRERITSDAIDIVRRYKHWEKESTKSDDGGVKESEKADESTTPQKILTKTEIESSEKNNNLLQRWNALSSHDKRKQYKRARQVIQALQGGKS